MTISGLLLALLAIFAAAKLFGELAERIGQPAVLGEMVGGVVIGVSGLRLINPHDPLLQVLAELGVLLLLFLIGLETDLKRLLSVGGASVAVALAGVVLPFAPGSALPRRFFLPRSCSGSRWRILPMPSAPRSSSARSPRGWSWPGPSRLARSSTRSTMWPSSSSPSFSYRWAPQSISRR